VAELCARVSGDVKPLRDAIRIAWRDDRASRWHQGRY
jgi:hypothetical protein